MGAGEGCGGLGVHGGPTTGGSSHTSWLALLTSNVMPLPLLFLALASCRLLCLRKAFQLSQGSWLALLLVVDS